MTNKLQQREHYLDSVRAWLMLLGVPFHLSLIYSTQSWSVNSPHPSEWLTLLNDFIHAFRMQVFFVISGYFSYMLYLRYTARRWIKMRLERVGIPMLAAVPLLTLPQLFILKEWTPRLDGWAAMTPYKKFNAVSWDLISHLWFLLVLCILTILGLIVFRLLNKARRAKTDYSGLSWRQLSLAILAYSLLWGTFRRTILLLQPQLLSNGLFSNIVMQSLYFLPFFILGAMAWKYPAIKALFVRPDYRVFACAALAFVAYVANQTWSIGAGWLYELDAVIAMQMGLWMVNVTFSAGHRFLNSHSPRIVYLVNASLFIYLVHHPLTLLYGIFITPLIASDTLGFFVGLLMVFGAAFLLYELHLRVALLRFLFSGKPQKMRSTGT
ncbi:glucans biosynthesis protein C [Izhakiella capsodis]|uniref:Glucans biosynthesis protein C n=1 Tax=Izhakiella capsodis TaxID=1367852 RepID=A0A1I4URK2_9GAMM|nr:glucans biosynthesis protein MdoC [Izhakiella capsodis]SFM91380.1 glucans biosynthesis protein C [Izhakiella capsodis]